jgi:hypothetical protein
MKKRGDQTFLSSLFFPSFFVAQTARHRDSTAATMSSRRISNTWPTMRPILPQLAQLRLLLHLLPITRPAVLQEEEDSRRH